MQSRQAWRNKRSPTLLTLALCRHRRWQGQAVRGTEPAWQQHKVE